MGTALKSVSRTALKSVSRTKSCASELKYRAEMIK